MARKSGLSRAIAEIEREKRSSGSVRLEREAAARQAQLPLAPVGAIEAPAGGRRGGRPAGALNRSTAEWRAFLLGSGQSPLVVLAQIIRRPTEQLARELGCSLLEAFDRQVTAAKELAPYLHSKMPQAIQLDTPGGIHLMLATPEMLAEQAGAGQEEGGVAVIEARVSVPEENQRLSLDVAGELDGAELDSGAEREEIRGVDGGLPPDLRSVSDEEGDR